MKSVRAISSGKSRDEVRGLITIELDRRGVHPQPTDSVLELMVDSVLSGTGRIARARLLAGSAGRIGSIIAGKISPSTHSKGLNLHLDREPLEVELDRSQPALEVQLDTSAQAMLGIPEDTRIVNEPDDVFVLLTAEPEELLDNSIDVRIDHQRIGVLNGEAAQLYSTVIKTGMELGQPVVTEAIRSQDTEGLWHLYVYPPLARPTKS